MRVTFAQVEIPVHNMKDGDIGVITSWSMPDYHGRVVQRYKDNLITLGEQSGQSFPGLLSHPALEHTKCRVRLLQPGDTITLEKPKVKDDF